LQRYMTFEDYRKRKPRPKVKPKKEEPLPVRRLAPEAAAARKSIIFAKRPKAERLENPKKRTDEQKAARQERQARRPRTPSLAPATPKTRESSEKSRSEPVARERKPYRATPESDPQPYRKGFTLDGKPKKKRSGKPRRWDPKKRKHVKPEPPKPPGSPQRVQKLIADAGLASRRQAEKWIEEGRVQVNGNTIKLGDQAGPNDEVTVNGAKLPKTKKIYLMVNKPKGYVTTVRDIYGNKTVMELVPDGERIYPIGRLDKDTTGLLLFTNDGDFANRIMHPRYEVQKTYIATLDKPFDGAHTKIAEKGIRLKEGVVTASIKILSPRRVAVTLHQGFNHVVKRVMKEMGYWVTDLERTKVGAVTLNIPSGAFRPLTEEELKSFS
jgi:23S rRNA pseudouridine2605 synthase